MLFSIESSYCNSFLCTFVRWHNTIQFRIGIKRMKMLRFKIAKHVFSSNSDILFLYNNEKKLLYFVGTGHILATNAEQQALIHRLEMVVVCSVHIFKDFYVHWIWFHITDILCILFCVWFHFSSILIEKFPMVGHIFILVETNLRITFGLSLRITFTYVTLLFLRNFRVVQYSVWIWWWCRHLPRQLV